MKPQRLTRAALETLAIIAYRQPVTRPEIEDIRGVDCGAVREGAARAAARSRSSARRRRSGRPILYGTTREFLEFFALKDLVVAAHAARVPRAVRGAPDTRGEGGAGPSRRRGASSRSWPTRSFERASRPSGAEAPRRRWRSSKQAMDGGGGRAPEAAAATLGTADARHRGPRDPAEDAADERAPPEVPRPRRGRLAPRTPRSSSPPGRVSVNNQTVTELGHARSTPDGPGHGGREARHPRPRRSVLVPALQAPRRGDDAVRSRRGGHGRRVPRRGVGARVFPVGRLDYDAEGALLLHRRRRAREPAAPPALRGRRGPTW